MAKRLLIALLFILLVPVPAHAATEPLVCGWYANARLDLHMFPQDMGYLIYQDGTIKFLTPDPRAHALLHDPNLHYGNSGEVIFHPPYVRASFPMGIWQFGYGPLNDIDIATAAHLHVAYIEAVYIRGGQLRRNVLTDVKGGWAWLVNHWPQHYPHASWSAVARSSGGRLIYVDEAVSCVP